MSRSETKKKQEEIFKKRRKMVKDGKTVDNKQFTINKDGKKVLKKRSIVEDLGKVLPFLPAGRIAGIASKVPGVKSGINKLIGSAKNLIKGDKRNLIKGDKKPKKLSVTGGGSSGTRGQGSGKFITQRANRPVTTRTTGGGQGSGRFITQRSNRPTNTQITKPKNTQLKKPSRSLVNRPNNKISSNKGNKQLANRAVVSTGVSELIKPKKSVANTIEKKIVKKDPVITKPNKSPITKVKKEKLKNMGPTKDYTGKFVNEKGEVAYDSVGDFFKNITGTAKKRARPENRKRIQADTKGATKGVGFSGKSVGNPFKFNKGGPLKSVSADNKGLGKLPTPVRNKMGYMRKGGVVKMRGGGAATRGMNFNRGY